MHRLKKSFTSAALGLLVGSSLQHLLPTSRTLNKILNYHSEELGNAFQNDIKLYCANFAAI